MSEERESTVQPAGRSKMIRQAILETGSSLLQDFSPMKQFDIYVAGFHPSKEDPSIQMEAHHYCKQVNQDFLQCVLFDGNTEEANLIGIEYISSEKLYADLPDEERKYWHPHNFEILSGQLVAPGLPEVAERAMLELLMNSYGKTWHTWHSGRHDQAGSGHPLPFGDPMLMWSFNRDGEADESMLQDRNRRMQIDVAKKRADRQEFVPNAHPQHGVDTLKGRFPGASTDPPPGVREATPRDGSR